MPESTSKPPADAVFRRSGRCASPRRTLSTAETRLTAVQSGHCGPVSSDVRHSGTHLHGFRIDELCYKVIGAGMAVHRHFGAGYLEEVYKNAMMVELGDIGLHADKEIPIPVNYKGRRVGDYRADIIVENRLILELKAVTTLNPSHEAQLVNYLNSTGIDDGLLINFGGSSLQHKHKYGTSKFLVESPRLAA